MRSSRARMLVLVAVVAAWPAAASAREVVVIKPADSLAKKLPGLGLELDVTGLGFSISKFPEAETYLQLSGPPGGPLGLIVKHCPALPADAKAFRALVVKETGEKKPLVGPEEKVTVAGQEQRAMAYIAGTPPARARGCVVLVAGKGAAASGTLLTFFESAGAKDKAPRCAALTKTERFAKLLGSLKLTLPASTPAKPEEPLPKSIGSAKMGVDGTIRLQLRATGGGAVGDALLVYKKDHPKYQEILKHLGGLKPGETKPVPPWPK